MAAVSADRGGAEGSVGDGIKGSGCPASGEVLVVRAGPRCHEGAQPDRGAAHLERHPRRAGVTAQPVQGDEGRVITAMHGVNEQLAGAEGAMHDLLPIVIRYRADSCIVR